MLGSQEVSRHVTFEGLRWLVCWLEKEYERCMVGGGEQKSWKLDGHLRRGYIYKAATPITLLLFGSFLSVFYLVFKAREYF